MTPPHTEGMKEPTIITNFVYPPIPLRQFNHERVMTTPQRQREKLTKIKRQRLIDDARKCVGGVDQTSEPCPVCGATIDECRRPESRL